MTHLQTQQQIDEHDAMLVHAKLSDKLTEITTSIPWSYYEAFCVSIFSQMTDRFPTKQTLPEVIKDPVIFEEFKKWLRRAHFNFDFESMEEELDYETEDLIPLLFKKEIAEYNRQTALDKMEADRVKAVKLAEHYAKFGDEAIVIKDQKKNAQARAILVAAGIIK